MRTIPTLATLLIGLSLAAPAFARDAAVTARTRARVAEELQCNRKAGKEVGNCLRDKYKSLREGRRLFIKQQQKRMEQWKLEHADMGLSEEFLAALHAFQAKMQQERNDYDAKLKELQKAIEAERLRVRDDSAERPVPETPSIKPSTKAQDCFIGSRDEQSRCLRNLLYPARQ